jgi:hypothetical protein
MVSHRLWCKSRYRNDWQALYRKEICRYLDLFSGRTLNRSGWYRNFATRLWYLDSLGKLVKRTLLSAREMGTMAGLIIADPVIQSSRISWASLAMARTLWAARLSVVTRHHGRLVCSETLLERFAKSAWFWHRVPVGEQNLWERKRGILSASFVVRERRRDKYR